MNVPRKHHFVPRFLLAAFAEPATASGRLFVLDRTRKKVFGSTPESCGYRVHFNRVEPRSHPDPLAVEKFFAKIENETAPVLNRILESKRITSKEDRSWLIAFVATQFVRTPRFRRWQEGKLFETLEKYVLRFTQDKAWRRRFERKQKAQGLPESTWTPEGYIAFMRSDQFSFTTDDDWKIGLSLQLIRPCIDALDNLEWSVYECHEEEDDLVLSDCPVSLVPLEASRQGVAVGFLGPSNLVCMPIGPRTALVGGDPGVIRMASSRITSLALNSCSFAWCLDQCFAGQDDFLIDDPERGPTCWSQYQQEGAFPKLIDDAVDIADEYSHME